MHENRLQKRLKVYFHECVSEMFNIFSFINSEMDNRNK